MDEDRNQELQQLVERLQAAQSDVEPFLALHTPDAVIVNFGGRRVIGRDAIEQAMRAGLATLLARVITTAEIEQIQFLRPDVALINCTKHISDQRGTTEPLPTTARLSYVAVEEDGEWRVALAHTTPVAGS